MPHIMPKYFYALWLVLVMFAVPAFAKDDAYKRVSLEHGISIEIPAHWTILSTDTRNNLAASSQAMMKNADIEDDIGEKKGLLAVNATPKPAGAMIRVSVVMPPYLTQSDLASATPHELKEAEQGMLDVAKKIEASGGPAIINMQPVQIESFSNIYRALVFRYERKGVNVPSPWQVAQYKIPVENKIIELTLSYRQSDAVIWKPILERVKRSIMF